MLLLLQKDVLETISPQKGDQAEVQRKMKISPLILLTFRMLLLSQKTIVKYLQNSQETCS